MGCIYATLHRCQACKNKVIDLTLPCEHGFCRECIEMEIRMAVRDGTGFGCFNCGRIITKDEALEAATALELVSTANPPPNFGTEDDN